MLPKLLAHNRTHAATEPVPRGFVSCAHIYPAHPLHDAYGGARPFDGARYAAFQRILSRHGDIEHVRLKRNVAKAIGAGAGPNAIATPADRFAQASVRVALRQIKASGGTRRSWRRGLRRMTTGRAVTTRRSRAKPRCSRDRLRVTHRKAWCSGP